MCPPSSCLQFKLFVPPTPTLRPTHNNSAILTEPAKTYPGPSISVYMFTVTTSVLLQLQLCADYFTTKSQMDILEDVLQQRSPFVLLFPFPFTQMTQTCNRLKYRFCHKDSFKCVSVADSCNAAYGKCAKENYPNYHLDPSTEFSFFITAAHWVDIFIKLSTSTSQIPGKSLPVQTS